MEQYIGVKSMTVDIQMSPIPALSMGENPSAMTELAFCAVLFPRLGDAREATVNQKRKWNTLRASVVQRGSGWDPWDQDEMSDNLSLDVKFDSRSEHQTSNRHHASIWGVSYSRGGPDDWRCGCFEWEGWKSAQNRQQWHANRKQHASHSAASLQDVEEDFYKTLGVPRFCSMNEIRRGYRAMARLYHPDVAGNSTDDAEQFIRLQRALDVLSDTTERALYDAKLRDKIGNRNPHICSDDVAAYEPRTASLPESDLEEFRLT